MDTRPEVELLSIVCMRQSDRRMSNHEIFKSGRHFTQATKGRY